MTDKDKLFNTPLTRPRDFAFDENVVRVFPDMINRSVPGYHLVVPMLGLLARRYAQANTTLYDLGCSLGAVSLAMQSAVHVPGARIVAVDNSEQMIAGLNQRIGSDEQANANIPIEPRLQDIAECTIENASVVVLNFTLQFFGPPRRLQLLQNIRNGLQPGGVLLLSEKVCFDDPEEQDLQEQWHHEFKRAQGYSDLEISQKRDALEHVMIPDSLSVHRQRLQHAGFDRVYRWYQGFNFISMVAFA